MITFGFRNKFSGLTRALIAILAGLAMIIWPSTSLNLIVKVIAAIICATGVVSLIIGITNRKATGLAVPVMNAVIDILVGVLLFMFSGQITGFVIILCGILFLGFGIFQCIAMISAVSLIGWSIWTFLFPALCVIGGILVLANPFGAANTAVIVAGVVALIYGISELVASWRMDKAQKAYEIKFPKKDAESQDDSQIKYEDIKDADYEKVD